MKPFVLRAVLASLFLATVVFAMTVRPPEFDELVAKADTVVRGTVTTVRSEWRGTGETRRIVTLVTFAVERCLVGDAPATVELEFLGGRVGDDRLTVPGQPQFARGDREILFVAGNGRQLCPLVHAMFGRFRTVAQDGGRTLAVERHDGVPLASVDDVKLATASPAMAERLRAMKREALTADDFEAEIIQRARALGKKAPP